MNPFFSDIPARGAALLERDRLIKAGLIAAGAVLGVGLVRTFYKPLLATAAVVYVGTRPPVRRALMKLTAQLREGRS